MKAEVKAEVKAWESFPKAQVGAGRREGAGRGSRAEVGRGTFAGWAGAAPLSGADPEGGACAAAGSEVALARHLPGAPEARGLVQVMRCPGQGQGSQGGVPAQDWCSGEPQPGGLVTVTFPVEPLPRPGALSRALNLPEPQFPRL